MSENILEHLEFKLKERDEGYFEITVRNTHPTNTDKHWNPISRCTYSKAGLIKLKDFLEEFTQD